MIPAHHALHSLCLVSESTYLLFLTLMSAHCSLRSCSLLRTIFGKIGNTYQAYCHTYKIHAMATHHGGSGQPLDRDATITEKDTDVDILHNFHHEDTDDFENIEHENHTRLAAITRKLDDLSHRVHIGEGQPMKAQHHIECQLQRLSIALCPSAPLESLDDILKQHMDTLCSAQKQTNFTNTLIHDISIFNGNDSTQLEDWSVDIETVADLSAESRTKLAQAKSKGLTLTLITEALNLG